MDMISLNRLLVSRDNDDDLQHLLFLSEESKCVDGTTVVIFFTSFIGLVPVASVFVASFCIIGFHQ